MNFDFSWNFLPCKEFAVSYHHALLEITNNMVGPSTMGSTIAMDEVQVIQKLLSSSPSDYDKVTGGIRYVGGGPQRATFPYLTTIVTELLTSPAFIIAAAEPRPDKKYWRFLPTSITLHSKYYNLLQGWRQRLVEALEKMLPRRPKVNFSPSPPTTIADAEVRILSLASYLQYALALKASIPPAYLVAFAPYLDSLMMPDLKAYLFFCTST